MTTVDDRPVAVTAKVFDALLYFVERRGELLDKRTLMKALWPDVIVEDNDLNQIISALRKVLGEMPGDHRFIVTVPGHGYRFVADVSTIAWPLPGMPQPNTACAPENPTTPSLSETMRGSIAVLPFVNLTGDSAEEYMSDGLAEEFISTPGRVRGVPPPALGHL